jgi:hypothetical protein
MVSRPTFKGLQTACWPKHTAVFNIGTILGFLKKWKGDSPE